MPARAIQKSKSHQGPLVPNLLPCRIHRDGSVDASGRYWKPVLKDGKKIAYFRGRKLYGREFKVPQGYKGVVLLKTNRVLPRENQDRYAGHEDTADIEENEEEQETGILEEKATFDNVMVWGHEVLVDKEDVYVRALEEWVGVAESIHSFAEEKSDAALGGEK
ncbi:hypothetical protein M430DRAFT_22240 [Amorphotheca resinae ATCC 22711]|uniref:Uncharacterized protein n=1 Tax=Amorphotheca resinae ATCC 22711 TaxID=857342 RepID=A0A2T3ATU7_AMORE|nr:hypothetical protein M430DRAFT_22240 [Amorphotheca resinae ATCC 22711]PSS10906.1 hypothetical protein M430DRAFT_22240 [Amorphotheca resinae ATCC 22711]